jgi:hypothetical protein
MFVATSLFGTKVQDVISAEELEYLTKIHTTDEILSIAKKRIEDGVDLEKIRKLNKQYHLKAKKIIHSTETNYNEYCIEDMTITDAKGKLYYSSLCLASNVKLNDIVVKDVLISQLSARSMEEMNTTGGKELLRKELRDRFFLTIKDELYFTKYIIAKKPYTLIGIK